MAFNIRVEILSPDRAAILFGNGTTAQFRSGSIKLGNDPFVLAGVAYGEFYRFEAPITGLSELVFECKVGAELSGNRKFFTNEGFTGNDVVNGNTAVVTFTPPFSATDGAVLYDQDTQYDLKQAATQAGGTFTAALNNLAAPSIYHFSCQARPSGAAPGSERDFFIASPDATFTTQQLPVTDITLTAVPDDFPKTGSTLLTATVLGGNVPILSPLKDKQVVFGPFPGSNPLPGTLDPSIAALTDDTGKTSVTFTPNRPGTIHLEVNCEGRTARVTIKVRN